MLSLHMSPLYFHKESPNKITNFHAADDVNILDYLEHSMEEFTTIYESKCSMDRLWEYFSFVVAHGIEHFIPKCNNKREHKNPWIIREIVHAKRTTQRERKACFINSSPEILNALRQMRKELNNLVRESRHNFFNMMKKKFFRCTSQILPIG